MTYQEEYQQKLTTAAEAVKIVKSGDWVDYGWCCNEPIELDKALAARANELYDVKVRGGVTMQMPEIMKLEDSADHFTWHSWHSSGIDRKIVGAGKGFFSPMRYSELPRFYRRWALQHMRQGMPCSMRRTMGRCGSAAPSFRPPSWGPGPRSCCCLPA